MEAHAPNRGRVKQIARVHDAWLLHDREDPAEVEPAELVPLREHDKDPRAGGGLVGVATQWRRSRSSGDSAAGSTVGSNARTVAPDETSRSTICRLGESRRSSVLALKVSPHAAIVTWSTDPPHAASVLAMTRANCSSLEAIAPARSEKSYPDSRAMWSSARVSLGKHDPPHPGPGRRNSKPILLSYPRPSRTSRASAPTSSQRPANALTKLNLVAKKALDAYLIVSDVVASVTMSGAPVGAKSVPTAAAAAVSSAPTTMRSGCMLSRTAVPSRRNSGFDTTLMSGRPITCSTIVAEPTGTVDLLTTTEPDMRWGAISFAGVLARMTGRRIRPRSGAWAHRGRRTRPS